MRLLKKWVDRRAEALRRAIGRSRLRRQGYDLYTYGSYGEYKAAQTEANRRKIGNVWVAKSDIEFLAAYLKRTLKNAPRFGLCHGTRQGLEQRWFRELLPGCEVIGTEISDTATQFPFTIEWDFHELKPEWVGAVDFIYSNSFDHSFDPDRCINAWMSCVRPSGVCVIEHSARMDEPGSMSDPFGVKLNALTRLIEQWGRGAFGVSEVVPGPILSGRSPRTFLIVRHSSASGNVGCKRQ